MSKYLIDDDARREIASLLPPPPVPESPAWRAQEMRQHLVTELRDAQRSGQPAGRQVQQPARHHVKRQAADWYRSRSLLAVAGAVCAAGAAAAVAVALLPSATSPSATSPSGSGHHVASPGAGTKSGTPSAVALLDSAAVAVASQPEPKVTDSEYVYVQDVEAEDHGKKQPQHRQIWIPVSNNCTPPGLLIENGRRMPLGNQDGSSNSPLCAGAVGDPTYRFLQSLPTDPRSLLDYIYAHTKGEGSSRDGEAFVAIGDMMRESIVPPRTAAALYRTAALIPGVQVVDHAVNALGESGIAVTRDGSEWIFNPSTHQFIGEGDQFHGYSMAIIKSGFVARPGQLP